MSLSQNMTKNAASLTTIPNFNIKAIVKKNFFSKGTE